MHWQDQYSTSYKTINIFTRTYFAVLSVHLRPWEQVHLSVLRCWIIAVELSHRRHDLVHDEGGYLFSNGVQIISTEGGWQHFELLIWKNKVFKKIATCRDKNAIIVYLTTIKLLKAKKRKRSNPNWCNPLTIWSKSSWIPKTNLQQANMPT